MKYYYYEHIAAELFGIKPYEMFEKTRKGEIKTSRQFCMKYRKEILRLSNSVSASRYSLDHATTINSRTKIQNSVDTKDDIGSLYLEFLQKCEEEKKQIELMGFANKSEFIKRVESMGWNDYVNTVKEPLYELVELVYKNSNEDTVREWIEVCEEKLGELKFLYTLENEPQFQN